MGFDKYRRKPEPVEAIEVTLENVEVVARLVGGQVERMLGGAVLAYPNLVGNQRLWISNEDPWMLVRDNQGRFSHTAKSALLEDYELDNRPVVHLNHPPGAR